MSTYEISAAGRAKLKRMIEDDDQARMASGLAEAPMAFADQHRIWGDKLVAGEDGPRRVRHNLAESPVTVLGRRREKDGRPFLEPGLVEAAERLREDFELAQLGPRVAQNWERFLTSGDRGGFQNEAGLAQGPKLARDRVAAARSLLARHPGIDVIVSDDGLQHYRLHRDLELAVIDASVGLGNGWPLPAGPLREPPARLRSVDAVVQVVRGTRPPRAYGGVKGWRVDTRPGQAWRLVQPQERVALPDLPLDGPCLAVTGIGRPQGFFDMLARAGLRCETRAFPDHHAFRPGELPVDRLLLMTEKDAVKCRSVAGTHWWAVELEVAPETGFIDWLDQNIISTRPPR